MIMTADAIIQRIKEEAEKEVQTIRYEESCELTDIRNLAEQKAEDSYNRRISEGERDIRQYVTSQQSKIRIEAKRLVREEKEELINRCFAMARQELHTIRSSNEYPKTLENLLKECIDSLGNHEIYVYVHSDDRHAMQVIVNRMNGDGNSLILSDEPVHTSGGMICVRASDRVTIDNTVEARFSRMQRELIVAASKILFQNGGPDG